MDRIDRSSRSSFRIALRDATRQASGVTQSGFNSGPVKIGCWAALNTTNIRSRASCSTPGHVAAFC